MTYTPTVVTHTESHNYDQSIVEAPTSNDPVNHELIDAAHCYARAFTAAKEALEAVQSSELALAHSDIEAVEGGRQPLQTVVSDHDLVQVETREAQGLLLFDHMAARWRKAVNDDETEADIDQPHIAVCVG